MGTDSGLDLPGHSPGYRGRRILHGGRAALPLGETTLEECLEFHRLRTKETVAEARLTFGDRATTMTDEMVLSLFYRELREKSLSTMTAE